MRDPGRDRILRIESVQENALPSGNDPLTRARRLKETLPATVPTSREVPVSASINGIVTILTGAALSLNLLLGSSIPARASGAGPAPRRPSGPFPSTASQPAASLEIMPGEVLLVGGRARHGLLVMERRGGAQRDVTRKVAFRSLDPT